MDKEFMKEIKEYKYNLEEVRSGIDKFQIILYKKINLENMSNDIKSEFDDVYLDLVTLLRQMLPSYISPAYHFNKYMDDLYTDIFWDEIKFEMDEEISMALREAKFIANLQGVITSIKTALDRMVVIFSYYYPGFAWYTTFGHIADNKGKRFMGKVCELAPRDTLMKFILDEYNSWIKMAVEPRNIIIHYNDLQTGWHFDSDIPAEIPIHICNKSMDKKYESFSFSFITIHEYCDRWYNFFDKVLEHLLKMDIIYTESRL
ncbi:hypothetical protein [Clostridium diolis]|uniref:hypothetical protein n=1 Tax=Clostridium diolis TaxID=223919 RepID=UPI003AF73327